MKQADIPGSAVPQPHPVGASGNRIVRAVGEEASRADVEAYKHPASSASATTTLGDIINWKRAGNDQD
jgi:hypothetical protein